MNEGEEEAGWWIRETSKKREAKNRVGGAGCCVGRWMSVIIIPAGLKFPFEAGFVVGGRWMGIDDWMIQGQPHKAGYRLLASSPGLHIVSWRRYPSIVILQRLPEWGIIIAIAIVINRLTSSSSDKHRRIHWFIFYFLSFCLGCCKIIEAIFFFFFLRPSKGLSLYFLPHERQGGDKIHDPSTRLKNNSLQHHHPSS